MDSHLEEMMRTYLGTGYNKRDSTEHRSTYFFVTDRGEVFWLNMSVQLPCHSSTPERFGMMLRATSASRLSSSAYLREVQDAIDGIAVNGTASNVCTNSTRPARLSNTSKHTHDEGEAGAVHY
jgi:hypothetical protein